MSRSADVRRGLAVVISLATLASPLLAQGPPREEFTNLKVLPKDIAPEELRALMNTFTRALGVRCIQCHVGEEGKPFKHEDFAKDDKPAKLKAREMMRMTQDLNDKYLANLADRSEPPIRIKCVTCHHGVTQPRPLEDVLKTAYDTGGMDSTLARYRALRERYYGRFAYDFGEVPLAELAGKVRTAGNREDALQLLAFNLEMNPNSAFAKRQYAASSLALAFVTGADSGAATYGRLKERYGAALVNEGMVNGIGYDLIGAGKTDAAIAAFAFNVAQNPQSANAYDSMGEGYYQKGDRKQAVAAYQKSLQLDPTNQNAIDKLKELKAKPKPAKKT